MYNDNLTLTETPSVNEIMAMINSFSLESLLLYKSANNDLRPKYKANTIDAPPSGVLCLCVREGDGSSIINHPRGLFLFNKIEKLIINPV